MAIFLTLIQRGSSGQGGEIDAPSALFNISLSTAILIVFIVLTVWVFAKLAGRKAIPKPKVT